MLLYETNNIDLTGSIASQLRALTVGQLYPVFESSNMVISFERVVRDRFNNIKIKIALLGDVMIDLSVSALVVIAGEYRVGYRLNAFSYNTYTHYQTTLGGYSVLLDTYTRTMKIREMCIKVFGYPSSSYDASFDHPNSSNNFSHIARSVANEPTIDPMVGNHSYISSLCINALGDDEDNTLEVGKCIICMVKKPCVSIVPCGHECYCVGCSKIVRDFTCPVCRVELKNIIRNYK